MENISKKRKLFSIVIVFCMIMMTVFTTEYSYAASGTHLKQKSAYIAVGDTYAVKLVKSSGKVIPASKIVWSSSKKSVATVSSKGIVKTKKEGTAKIYAKYDNKKYTFIAKVKKPYISLDKEALILGSKTQGKLKLTSSKQLSKAKVDWDVENASIVSINGDGEISAVGLGTTTLTATYKNKVFKKDITVGEPELLKEHITVEVGNEANQVLYVQTPSGKKIDWSESELTKWICKNTDVASITKKNNKVYVNGISPGNTIAIANVNGKEYNFNIKVIPKMKMNYTEKNMDKGSTLQLEINQDSVTWRTNNPDVASVSSTGVVTAVDYGTAIITAEIDGISCSCRIVIAKPTLYAEETSVTISPGDTKNVYVTFTKNGSVKYDIKDSSVVSCRWGDFSGGVIPLRITAKDPGTTYVTISNTYDNTEITIKVFVEAPIKIVLPPVPQTINSCYFDGAIATTCKITNIYIDNISYYSYKDSFSAKICFDGIKTYDKHGNGNDLHCIVKWKLYDINGAVVASGKVITSDLAVGEKFVGEHITLFDLKKGGTYTLKISDDR